VAGAGLIYLVFTFFIYVFPSKFPPNDSHTPQSILFWSFHLGDWGDYYRVADTSLHQFYQDPPLELRPNVWVGTGSGPGFPERNGSGSGILDRNGSGLGLRNRTNPDLDSWIGRIPTWGFGIERIRVWRYKMERIRSNVPWIWHFGIEWVRSDVSSEPNGSSYEISERARPFIGGWTENSHTVFFWTASRHIYKLSSKNQA